MSIDVYADINIPVNYELHDAMTFAFGFCSFKSSFNEIIVYIETLSYTVWLVSNQSYKVYVRFESKIDMPKNCYVSFITFIIHAY